MKTKLLKAASLIAAAAIVSAVPLSVSGNVIPSASLNAYAETSGSLTYEKYDDHVEITGSDYTATSIEIPSSIDGLPVTAIGAYAFNGSSLTSVTIPDSVKTIGMYAFAISTDLKSVTIPDSVEYIEFQAFETCTSLSEVNLPDKLIEMGSGVFEETPWLEAQRQKSDLVIISGNLIDGYGAKGDVVIPSDVKYVSGGAFSRNENITSVVLPSGVKKIADSTFFSCSNLKSADLRYCTEIGSMAFAYCDKLSDLKLSGQLTSIDGYAFSDISSRAAITVYGSKADWDKVDKNDEDEFLKNATYTFDESFVPPVEDVKGDVNSDGDFNTSDLVLLSKWLLTDPSAELKNWKAGDFTEDGKLDVYDLVLMRKGLTS